MAEYIKRQDSLNTGREKINNELTKANNNASKAKSDSAQALLTAIDSMDLSESVKLQLNQLIIDGDSSVEAAAARVDEENKTHDTLKDRIDDGFTKTKTQLAETDSFRGKESMINRKRRRPMITIVDDDGNRGVYTKLYELAKEYNIKFTSAMITDRPMGFPGDNRPYNNRYYHYNEVMEMNESGLIEFISHTHSHDINHRLEDMTEEERLTDMRLSRDFLKKYDLNYRAIAYAFGSYTQDVVESAREVFDYAIGTGTRGDEIVLAPFDNYDMRRSHGQYGVERVKRQIDKAIDENAWVIFTTHVDQGDWYSDEYMREIIEYALSNGIEFVSTAEGYASHGNIAQLGNSIVTADGKFIGDDFAYLGRNALTPNDTPTNPLLYGRKTITNIMASGALGFPEDKGGQLITYAYQEYAASQEYKLNESYRKFKRVWYPGSKKWSAWVLVENIVRNVSANENDFDASTNRAEFSVGVTETILSSDNNLDLTPEGRPGLLTTHIVANGGIRHHYQEFIDYSRGSIFRRQGTGTTDNGWDVWKTIFDGS